MSPVCCVYSPCLCRAFSGSLLSHDSYVFLDVAYIAAALKPILNHKIDERSTNGVAKFSGKELVHHKLQSGAELASTTLLSYRDDLVKRGILRREFASFLWEDPTRKQAVPQKSLQGILEELGVAIPLPQSPATQDGERDCTDLLVLMRLDKQPDEGDRDGIEKVMGGETGKLRAVWKFGFGGAPYGFPEEVIALCHRLGKVSPNIYWRHGALFSRKECGVPAKAKALVRYDEKSETLTFETSGREEWDFVSLRFAISAVRHVTVKFPGVFWEGWVACWQHPDQRMYYLAGSTDHLNGPRVSIVLVALAIPPSVRKWVFSVPEALRSSSCCSWLLVRTTLGVRYEPQPYFFSVVFLLYILCAYSFFAVANSYLLFLCGDFDRGLRLFPFVPWGTSYR